MKMSGVFLLLALLVGAACAKPFQPPELHLKGSYAQGSAQYPFEAWFSAKHSAIREEATLDVGKVVVVERFPVWGVWMGAKRVAEPNGFCTVQNLSLADGDTYTPLFDENMICGMEEFGPIVLPDGRHGTLWTLLPSPAASTVNLTVGEDGLVMEMSIAESGSPLTVLTFTEVVAEVPAHVFDYPCSPSVPGAPTAPSVLSATRSALPKGPFSCKGPSSPKALLVIDSKALGSCPADAAAMTELLEHPVEKVLTFGGHGCIAVAPSYPAATASLSTHPSIVHVARDDDMKAYSAGCLNQHGAPWNLVRLTEKAVDLTRPFRGVLSNESAVHVVVIDTGASAQHKGVGGRVELGPSFDTEVTTSFDQNGHGTHVTGTIADALYGVAKTASVEAVRVLGRCGQGTVLASVEALNYVTTLLSNGKHRRVVVNMSLGGPTNEATDSAVNAAVEAGAVVVVAAGNEDSDACGSSPAAARLALTVGATTHTDGKDARAYFSNWGECVDVFAPGQAIPSDWIGAEDAVNTISGTSMATPLVAGQAAALWASKPHLSASEVKEEIIRSSLEGLISLNCAGSTCPLSPNRLVHVECSA